MAARGPRDDADQPRRGQQRSDKRKIPRFLPVEGEVHDPLANRTTSVRIAALLQLPDLDAERRRFPLAGRDGTVWNDTLQAIARRRPDVDLFNVDSCRPPGPSSGAWDRMEKGLAVLRDAVMAEAKAANPALKQGELKRMAATVHPHPADCCRERLLADLGPYENLLALGNVAYKTLTGEAKSSTKTMGSPDEMDIPWRDGTRKVKLFSLPHPTHVLHTPSWRMPYARLLAKAFRFFEGKLNWVDPIWLINPRPTEFREWLRWVKETMPFISVDTETDSISPMRTRLELFQVATPDLGPDGKVTDDLQLAATRGVLSQVVVLIFPCGAYGKRDRDIETKLFGQPIRYMLQRHVEEHRQIIADLMTDEDAVKFGFSLGYYDRMVLESGKEAVVKPGECRAMQDLHFACRFRAPDFPKDLKTNGVTFTDVERWDTTASGEKALRSKLLHVRTKYAGYDSCVGARVAPVLVQAAADAGAFRELPVRLRPKQWPPRLSESEVMPVDTPWNLWELDHERQRMSIRMHRRGLWRDPEEVVRLRTRYEASVEGRKAKLALIVGQLRATGMKTEMDFEGFTFDPDMIAEDGDFNPTSSDKMRVLLYDELGLTPPSTLSEKDIYTDTGQLSTGDPVLRAFLAEDIPPLVRDLIVETRLTRRERNKVLGTFLWPLVWGGDRQSEFLWADGRIRASWNSHSTAPARLSCSGFPLQIIGSRKGLGALKRLFCAQTSGPPGWNPADLSTIGLVWQCHDAVAIEVLARLPDGSVRRVLIYVDLDQAHMRIMANHWRIARLQECFTEGLDPYGVLALTFFGDEFRNADGWGPAGFDLKKKPPIDGSPALAMRETAKVARLALAYRVEVPTATATIMATEFEERDKQGRPTGGTQLPFLNLQFGDLTGQDVVAHWRDLLFKDEPDWERAWAEGDKRYVDNGGYLEDPILRRRSGGLSDGKPTEVANNEILTAEASLMALIEREVERVFTEDVCASGEYTVQELCGMLTECASVSVPSWDIGFTGTATWGPSLADQRKP